MDFGKGSWEFGVGLRGVRRHARKAWTQHSAIVRGGASMLYA
jgi:hypothetical protein